MKVGDVADMLERRMYVRRVEPKLAETCDDLQRYLRHRFLLRVGEYRVTCELPEDAGADTTHPNLSCMDFWIEVDGVEFCAQGRQTVRSGVRTWDWMFYTISGDELEGPSGLVRYLREWKAEEDLTGSV